jgi:ABC-type transport system involved in multi-copper enzyme maturation permease subunit
MIRWIAARELWSHLHNLGFWLLLALAQVVVGWLTFAQLDVYAQISPQLVAAQSGLGINDLVIAPSLNSLGLLLLVVVPLLGLHGLTEERRSGQLAVLLSTPLSGTALVLGKWLGTSAAALLILLAMLLIPTSLAFGMQVDFPRLAIATTGLLLLVLFSCALSLAFAAFSRHISAAATATLGTLLFLWLLDSLLSPSAAGYWLALNPHLQNILSGTLLLRDLGYFLLLGAGALGIAMLRVALERDARTTPHWRLLLFVTLSCACMLAAGTLSQRLDIRLASTQDTRIPQALEETLQALEGPVVITAYAPDIPLLRARIEKSLLPLQLRYRELELRYVDPQKQPHLAREQGIRHHGEMIIEGMGRRQHVRQPDLDSLAMALGRIARQGEPWVISLRGHGEASPDDRSPRGLSALRDVLERQGYRVIDLDPLSTTQIPRNTALLLVAGSRQDYPPHVTSMLQRYLQDDGRLLWLHEGANSAALQQLSGLATLPGRVVDPAAHRAGLAQRQVPLGDFPDQLLAQPPGQYAVLDGAVALAPGQSPGWRKLALLHSSGDAWNETAPPEAPQRRDPLHGEQQGPLVLGAALQRDQGRLVVLGDSDFVRNAALGAGGNRALALGLVNWLTGNRLATARPADDIAIEWSPRSGSLAALLHVLFLPVLYLGVGLLLRWHRRRA